MSRCVNCKRPLTSPDDDVEREVCISCIERYLEKSNKSVGGDVATSPTEVSSEVSPFPRYQNVIGVGLILGGLVLGAFLYSIVSVPVLAADVPYGAGQSTYRVEDCSDAMPLPLPSIGSQGELRFDSRARAIKEFCAERWRYRAVIAIGVAALGIIGGALILALPRDKVTETNPVQTRSHSGPKLDASPPPSKEPDSDIAERLATLDQLLAQGVIAKDEHANLRADILAEI